MSDELYHRYLSEKSSFMILIFIIIIPIMYSITSSDPCRRVGAYDATVFNKLQYACLRQICIL